MPRMKLGVAVRPWRRVQRAARRDHVLLIKIAVHVDVVANAPFQVRYFFTAIVLANALIELGHTLRSDGNFV